MPYHLPYYHIAPIRKPGGLGTIGNTPLARLDRIVREVPATGYAKVETFNPGHSIKDRMAVRMIEDAEGKGLLKPGGTMQISLMGFNIAAAMITDSWRSRCTIEPRTL